ncbi:hypothetical protein [Roseibium sp.]|uniref:hypothetical protein n=1 Tax=Roseibium sp. TaxID=1936156 RepID=UPI003B52818F
MFDPIQVLWSPAGAVMPNLGSRALTDVSDGDTPNIRMPIRMLSIDTPEVTARSENGAAKVDAKFLELAGWIEDGKAPVSSKFATYILPRLKTGTAGTLQFEQGSAASAWFKNRINERLTRPTGSKRKLFMATADKAFDNYNRLLAYVSPSYTRKERDTMSRRERATFNLDLVGSGWAAPFILFPNIPGELDLPLYLDLATKAANENRGQYGTENFLPAYEYRMCEKLYSITKKIVDGDSVTGKDRYKWRSRYAADMRDRKLYGPESYMDVPLQYRIWIWPDDVQKAIGALNLIPEPDLVD